MRFVVALLALLLTGPVAAQDLYVEAGGTLYFSGGGSLNAFDKAAEDRAEAHRPFKIAGACMSACTMFLAVPGTCVGRHASLWFHAPTPDTEAGRQQMLRRYPASVRAWIDRQGGLRPDWIVLTGPDLWQRVPLCDADGLAGL